MSSVIEIDSSDDEAVDVDRAPTEDDEVIILSGEVETTNNNLTNIDLTNDTALNDFVEDILKTYKNITFTREFLQFVKLSYDLESSDGMKRIIVKNLVPAYTKANPDYTSSNRFKIFVLNSIYKMNTSPEFKFSHLKDLCDVLKSKSVVKRAKLITQCNTVSVIKRNKQPAPEVPSKKQKLDVIDLDEEVINLDSVEDVNHNEEKENSYMQKTATFENIMQSTVAYQQNIVTHDQNIENSVPCEQETTFSKDKLDKYPNMYNSPVERRIIDLEEIIKSRKMLIEKLEQQEVDWDDDCSAYIRVDGLKLELVLLYKQLCKLRGENLTPKTKQIRLYPADGRHPGPSEKLEFWLNSHTEENGMPRFPDLFDVVKCVEEACKEYVLKWDKAEVLHEARLLFTQCGKALQRRRQKREWKELLRAAPDDPAEHDPELQARLEYNRKVARAREEAVLTHFSTLDDENRVKRSRNQRRNSDNITTPEPTCNIVTNPTYVSIYSPVINEYHKPNDMRLSTPAMADKDLLDPKDIPFTSNARINVQGVLTYINDLNQSDDTDQTSDNENPKLVNEHKNQSTLAIKEREESYQPNPKDYSNSEPGCSFQETLVAYINNVNQTDDVTKKENTKNVIETKNQVVQITVLNNATLRELRLNNFVESQMDNENNTNIELDRIGNINSEDQDTVETVPLVQNVPTDNDNMLIEQDIPIENGYDGLNVVKIESEDVKFKPKQEIDDIKETETEFLFPTDMISCKENTVSDAFLNICEDTNKQIEDTDGNVSYNDLDMNTEEQIADDSLLNNTHTNCEGDITIKTENIKKEDETLKLMLEFDGEFSETVITTVFDIEEPVVFIEISSSEDESEFEDFNDEEDLIKLGDESL